MPSHQRDGPTSMLGPSSGAGIGRLCHSAVPGAAATVRLSTVGPPERLSPLTRVAWGHAGSREPR